MKNHTILIILCAIAIAANLAAFRIVPQISNPGTRSWITQDEPTQPPEQPGEPAQLPYFEPTATQPANNGLDGWLWVILILVVIVIFSAGWFLGRRRPKENQ